MGVAGPPDYERSDASDLSSAASSKQTAALLNAQAIHLDVSEVIDLVPEEWPLHTVSDFIGRSLKQQLHERSTWQSKHRRGGDAYRGPLAKAYHPWCTVLKAISAGQNMATAEQYALEMGKRAPCIDAASPPDEGSITDHEYSSMRERKFDFGSEFGSAASEKEKSPMDERAPPTDSLAISSEKHRNEIDAPAVSDSLR